MKWFCATAVCIGLVEMFCVDVSYGMNASVSALKADLNTEFGYQAGNDMFAIIVTRTPAPSGFAPLISHSEFEQVLKLLYASCVDPGNWLTRWWRGSDAAVSPPYVRGAVTLNNTVDNRVAGAGGLSAREVDAVDSLKEDIGRYFLSNNMQNACKLLVFNEMFFSQMDPLDTNQKNFIEEKIFSLSRNTPNTIFYPNFLYTEIRNIPGRDVHNVLARMGANAGNDGVRAVNSVFPNAVASPAIQPNMNFDDATRRLTGCARRIQQANVPNNENLINWEYLVNETHAINNGEVLTRYKKVGYYHENDSKIARGVLYDSGPGYDEAVLIGCNTLRDKLLRNISIDICLDLPLGIRRSGANHWTNPGGVPLGDSRLHLIQSNSIDPFYNTININNLPRDRGILHADEYPHPSWNTPTMVSRFQDIYFPYIDAGTGALKDDFSYYESEFHIRIVESDYKFSFLKI